MKLFAILTCVLFATIGFAQQSPAKQTIDSLSTIDNMPIHKGHGNAIGMLTHTGQGNAIDMPTRKGQGNDIDIPNRITPIPSAPGEHSALVLPNLKWFPLDSSTRLKPNNAPPFKKN